MACMKRTAQSFSTLCRTHKVRRALTYSILQHSPGYRCLWPFHRFLCSSDKPDNFILSADQSSTTEESADLLSVSTSTSRLKSGPPFEHFLHSHGHTRQSAVDNINTVSDIPYLSKDSCSGKGRNIYFETYGCQMNVSDTEVVWSILKQNGFNKTTEIMAADVILVMTCAIREGAEGKIWNRLEYYKSIKTRRGKKKKQLKIGILGCMAERLKHKILDREKMVDVVCGPDAYRDLPRLLTVTEPGQSAVNVLLSLEETYADVMPVRLNEKSSSAFVSIMRGCDNMCTYCIVPFTRGRERSRPITSIVDEVKSLSEQGVKEVTLLGQNVNSYRDTSTSDHFGGFDNEAVTKMSAGFSTVYKHKKGGRRFSDLLDKVSLVDPEMRIRFTSPHPKDFPDEVLHLINERSNLCNHIHIPAQSGNTEILEAMRRGYSREAYIELIDHIRDIIPSVGLTGDFIAGFCGESEEAHNDSLSLIHYVKYSFAFCFPYSMREKTRAYHKLNDDVPSDVKSRRTVELIDAFRIESEKLNKAQIGQRQLVLIEGTSKRSERDVAGRNDGNTKVIVPNLDIATECEGLLKKNIRTGDYIVAKITSANSQVLKGIPLYHTSLQDFYRNRHKADISEMQRDVMSI